MRYTWMDEYLLNKRGVTKDLQPSWNWIRYMVGGKMFAAICLDSQDTPYYINLKLEPMYGAYLRSKYDDVIPGYYSDKQHWNSVKPDGAVPDELLKSMLDQSYSLILASFPKKRQREILGLTVCGLCCAECSFYGSSCKGCNETGGRVFHAPKDSPCPIYACCVNRHRYITCKTCDQLPCHIWEATRDPGLTEREFEESIRKRISNLEEA